MYGEIGPFDRFAPLYELLVPPARAAALRAGLALAEREVRVALDVGGPGRAVRRLDCPERIAVDAAPGAARRSQGSGLSAVVGDPTRLPVRTDGVDAVLVVDALHHMGDVAGVLSEAERVLRPGGVLVVREFDPTTLRGRGLVAADRVVGFDPEFLTPDDLAERLARAGLSPTVVRRGVGYTVAGVIENGEAK